MSTNTIGFSEGIFTFVTMYKKCWKTSLKKQAENCQMLYNYLN